MKLKTLLLTSSLIAVAALFSYCTKEAQTTEPVVTNTDQEAVDRGFCKVKILTNGTTVDICGTQSNTNTCGLLMGTETNVNGVATYLLATPATLEVTNVGPTANASITVMTSTSTQTYSFFPTGVVTLNIDNNCNQ